MCGVNLSVVIYFVAVDIGCQYFVVECLAVDGSPTAAAQHHIIADDVGRVGVNHYQVGKISGANVAAAVDVEQSGRCVTHFLNHGLDGEQSFVGHFKHKGQRELHERTA